jgi:DNA-binding response OmpR family regulator
MRLLLVEDSSRLRWSLVLGLKKAGYAVDESGDGLEGLWKAETGQYGSRYHVTRARRI